MPRLGTFEDLSVLKDAPPHGPDTSEKESRGSSGSAGSEARLGPGRPLSSLAIAENGADLHDGEAVGGFGTMIENLAHAHLFWMQRKFHSRETRKSLAALERQSIDARFEHTIDSRYDTTPRRLQQMYSKFDYDNDGMITVAQLRKGLESQDFHLSDEAFAQLLAQANIPPDTCAVIDDKCIDVGHVNLDNFSLILRCLRLAELFPLGDLSYSSVLDAALERMQKSVVLRVTDYSSEFISRQWPVTDHVSFFFSGRPREIENNNGVRWVHVQELEATTLLKLATKYQLHPLAVEDALQMIREPAKVNTYGKAPFAPSFASSKARWTTR
jgi:hypothetical protein